jgi:hypothetical protein
MPSDNAAATLRVLSTCPEKPAPQLVNGLDEPQIKIESEQLVNHRGGEDSLAAIVNFENKNAKSN